MARGSTAAETWPIAHCDYLIPCHKKLWRNIQPFSSATQIHVYNATQLHRNVSSNYHRWQTASQLAELFLRRGGLHERKWGPILVLHSGWRTGKALLTQAHTSPTLFYKQKETILVTFDKSIYSCVLTASTLLFQVCIGPGSRRSLILHKYFRHFHHHTSDTTKTNYEVVKVSTIPSIS